MSIYGRGITCPTQAGSVTPVRDSRRGQGGGERAQRPVPRDERRGNAHSGVARPRQRLEEREVLPVVGVWRTPLDAEHAGPEGAEQRHICISSVALRVARNTGP